MGLSKGFMPGGGEKKGKKSNEPFNRSGEEEKHGGDGSGGAGGGGEGVDSGGVWCGINSERKKK